VAATNSMYRIRVVAYASKRGSSASNSNLSYARADATLKYLQSIDQFAMERTETFRAVGEDAYSASESDDSPEWRAVEVHIFIGDIPPPPPPPGTQPMPYQKPRLPHGPRYTDWEVGSPGGVFVAAIVGGGFNVFFIRNPKLNDVRGYIQPVGGVGIALDIKKLKMIWKIIKDIITGSTYSKIEYTKVKSRLPVNWSEIESCLVRVASAGGGVGATGYAAADISFTAAGVWQYGPSGVPVKKPGGQLFKFRTKGKTWQLGAGASAVVGPLIGVA